MEKLLKLLKVIDENILTFCISFFIFFIPLFPKIPFKTINYTYVSIRLEDIFIVKDLLKKAASQMPALLTNNIALQQLCENISKYLMDIKENKYNASLYQENPPNNDCKRKRENNVKNFTSSKLHRMFTRQDYSLQEKIHSPADENSLLSGNFHPI